VDSAFAHYTSSSHTAGEGVGHCHDVEERVNDVLLMMGLEDVADTVIGKWMHVVRTVVGCFVVGVEKWCSCAQRWRAAMVRR
jgi:hypothetical protein